MDDLPSGIRRDALNRWLAPNRLARTSITTRTREYDDRLIPLELGVLDPQEGYDLLTKRRQPRGDKEVVAARGIVEDLGRHALAVDVTSGYLNKMAGFRKFAEVRAELAERNADPDLVARFEKGELPNGHETSIVKTILRSVEQLDAGLNFLLVASELAVAPIPGPLVELTFRIADPMDKDVALDRAVVALDEVLELSLAEPRKDEEGTYSVHTLVSRVVRFQKEWAQRRSVLRTAAISALTEKLSDAADIRKHHEIRHEVAHARFLAGAASSVEDAALLVRLGRYEHTRGALSVALGIEESALALRRRLLGKKHRETLISLNNLALTRRALGDLAGARELQEEDLELCVRNLVETDIHALTSMLSSMENWGVTLRLQGGVENLTTAHRLQDAAVLLFTLACGPHHRDTRTARESLAKTLRAQGHTRDTKRIQEEVLAARRAHLQMRMKRLIEKDIDALISMLFSMENLGVILKLQGGIENLAIARRLQEAAVLLLTLVLGPHHRDTLTAMESLAETLRAQGYLQDTKRIQEEVLAARRAQSDDQDPETLRCLVALGGTYYELGDASKARELEEEALDGCRKVYGATHPEMSNAAFNLFLSVRRLGLRERGNEILKQELLWLLEKDPAELEEGHRIVRGKLLWHLRR